MKNLLKLSALTFTAFLLLATQAHATVVTENLDVEVIFGPGIGTLGTIDVTYDDFLVPTFGFVALDQSEVTLELDLFGQLFGNSDDVDFPSFPIVEFEDSVIIFINYVISESLSVSNPTDIIDPTIGAIFGGDVFSGIWEVETEGLFSVPEPATALLLGLGLIGVGLRRQRKSH